MRYSMEMDFDVKRFESHRGEALWVRVTKAKNGTPGPRLICISENKLWVQISDGQIAVRKADSRSYKENNRILIYETFTW
jgi:hypothetical protein